LLSLDIRLVKLHVVKRRPGRALARFTNGDGVAIEPDDLGRLRRDGEGDPAPTAPHIEHTLAGQPFSCDQREKSRTDAGRGRQRRHSSPSSFALKYLASGWWNTSADTDASGSIMNPSVRPRPICSGRRRSKSTRWSPRFGHAG